jgi:hypothetical protein
VFYACAASHGVTRAPHSTNPMHAALACTSKYLHNDAVSRLYSHNRNYMGLQRVLRA